ncbi:hypothetical protein D3C86_1627760 [compost metagenome]
MVDNHRKLTGEGRVIGAAVGNGGRDHMAAAILVLQPFSAQRRAPGGGAEQKATGALVGRSPNQIADTLETEHRVVDVERQHRFAVRAVRRRGSDPGRQCTGFGDALLQQLTVTGFTVIEHRTSIFWFVQLAER